MSVYSSSIPRVVGPVQGIFIASSGSAVAIAFVVSQSPLLRRLEWRRRRERFRRVPAIGDGLRSSCSLRSVAVVDWRDSWKKASSAAPALDASEGATSGGDCPSLRRLGSSWSGAETGLMGVAACRCLGKMGGWPAGGMPRTWKLCPTKVPPRSGPQSPPSPERRGRKGWAGATLKSAHLQLVHRQFDHQPEKASPIPPFTVRHGPCTTTPLVRTMFYTVEPVRDSVRCPAPSQESAPRATRCRQAACR